MFSNWNWPAAHPRQAELQVAPFSARTLRAACIMVVNGTVGRDAARCLPAPIIASLRDEDSSEAAAVPCPVERLIMDLVTLVAACALTVDPKLVHALIWHQSGGEPWAFSVPGERQPQVYPSAQEAIREARFAEGVPIRVGLTGLATDSRTATLAMFMPCANISIAARQITQLHERKTVPPPGTDPVHCAVAAYRGFWEHPDKKFADAVLRSVVKADAPNFDMQNATYGGSSDIPPQAPDGGRHASTTSPVAPDDQQRGWSSALFPARSQQFGRVSTGQGSNNPDADRLQETNDSRPHDPVTMVYSCADCLSGGRNDWFEDGSHDFACCRAFGSEARGRRRPDRPMAG